MSLANYITRASDIDWQALRTPRAYSVMTAGAVALLWLIAVRARYEFLFQIPVQGADVTTSFAVMAARTWWIEGAWHSWFATPYSPLSVETPTYASRMLYQSFPPGYIAPIYLVASLLGREPDVPMVNWINFTSFGLLTLAVSFTAYHIARLNRLSLNISATIAVIVAIPILFSPGMNYFFSQIYCTTTHVLPHLSVFLLLEAVFLRAQSGQQRRLILIGQTAVIFWALMVDWLAYTVFATWFALRLAGGRFLFVPQWSRNEIVALVCVPLAAFGLYLTWRLGAPGSMANTSGVGTSLYELAWKALYRMNLTDASPVSGFGSIFLQIHKAFFVRYALPTLTAGALLLCLVLILSSWSRLGPDERRLNWATGSIALLALVPFYAHLLLLYQHTAIHQWAISRIAFAYALIPFALLPAALIRTMRLSNFQRLHAPAARQRSIAFASGVIALAAIASALVGWQGSRKPNTLGWVSFPNYQMWHAIRVHTGYHDIVVSPVLQAPPIGIAVGLSNKLVYPATAWAEVDQRVATICEPFNVVIATPRGVAPGLSGMGTPDEVIEETYIVLQRFRDYRGARKGCA